MRRRIHLQALRVAAVGVDAEHVAGVRRDDLAVLEGARRGVGEVLLPVGAGRALATSWRCTPSCASLAKRISPPGTSDCSGSHCLMVPLTMTVLIAAQRSRAAHGIGGAVDEALLLRRLGGTGGEHGESDNGERALHGFPPRGGGRQANSGTVPLFQPRHNGVGSTLIRSENCNARLRCPASTTSCAATASAMLRAALHLLPGRRAGQAGRRRSPRASAPGSSTRRTPAVTRCSGRLAWRLTASRRCPRWPRPWWWRRPLPFPGRAPRSTPTSRSRIICRRSST